MEDQEKAPACIPFFAHENALMHYNHANKRMLIALVTVCVTFVLYTKPKKSCLSTSPVNAGELFYLL